MEPLAASQQRGDNPRLAASLVGTSTTRLRRVLRLPATLNRVARNVFVYDVCWVLESKKDHDHVSPSDLKRQDSTQPRCKIGKKK